MKSYMVKFEKRPDWNNENDLHDDSQWIVTEQELKELAEAWNIKIDELMEDVEEI
jgi:hypothetical protein